MDSISSATSFAFTSALTYQNLSTETPQQLQTAGVFTIPTAPTAAPASTDTSSTNNTDIDSTSTDGTSTTTTSTTPTQNETTALMSSLSSSVGSSDPFMLANTYLLLNTGAGQVISKAAGSSANLGQQVDTQV